MNASVRVTNPNGASVVHDNICNVFPNSKTVGAGRNKHLVYKKPYTVVAKPNKELTVVVKKQLKKQKNDGNKKKKKGALEDGNEHINQEEEEEYSPVGFDAQSSFTLIKRSTSKKEEYNRNDGLDIFHDRVRKRSDEERRQDSVDERRQGSVENDGVQNVTDVGDNVKYFVMKEIDDMFKLLDVKGDGVLDVQEVKSAYTSMGVNVTQEEVGIIVQGMLNKNKKVGTAESERTAELTYDDFVAAMYKEVERGVKDDDLDFLFGLLDGDGDGFLRESDIVDMFQKCGRLMNEYECREVVDKLDVNCDGLIDVEDFKNFFRRMDVYTRISGARNKKNIKGTINSSGSENQQTSDSSNS